MNDETYLEIVNLTRPLVVAECRRAMRDAPPSPVLELRDLVQDVHLAMWQGRDCLYRARNAEGWVRRLAQRTARRSLRRVRPWTAGAARTP
jgi:DNA-directed RNA polymerase specialized sigma24 family protein